MEKRRGGQGRPRAPSPSSPNWTRRGARPPFLPLSLPLPPSPNPTRKGGSPTPGGSRTPPGAPPPGGPPLPPCSFIYGGRGHPKDTTIDHLIFSPCAVPPSTLVHLDNTVVVLTRSPASVERHHRHHAVVLTKLSFNTPLDRSSRYVIGLNVC